MSRWPRPGLKDPSGRTRSAPRVGRFGGAAELCPRESGIRSGRGPSRRAQPAAGGRGCGYKQEHPGPLVTQRPSDPEDLEVWSSVDRYYEDLLHSEDEILRSALSASRAAGLPDIQVSPLQGRLLHLLAKLNGARRILEIGTLGGYSAIWLARALPPAGRLLTLEIDPRHAEVARASIARAGLEGKVEVRVGPALETLPRLPTEPSERFDLVFIDADKVSYREYLEWAVRLSRKGSLIIADNVVRRGDVVEGTSTDANVQGVRRMNETLATDARLAATVIQTVGVKGHDGFVLAVVVSDP